MSQQLINRNPDLKQLRDEGYDIETKGSYLLVKSVPYVNEKKEFKRGTLITQLALANDITVKPGDHTVYFAGDYPCSCEGVPIKGIQNQSQRFDLGNGIIADHRFSAKPVNGYDNHFHKMTTYVAILSAPAKAMEPTSTAKTFPLISSSETASVFNYLDTASSRAEIDAVTEKLNIKKVGIIGLGGTGSYVLDLVAKTPVKEIHLYDGDVFFQHNAFRSPGAPCGLELEEKLPKTTYFSKIYSKMRKGVVGHAAFIGPDNIAELQDMDYVFLCLDRGSAKKYITEKLEEFGISYIDVGMGIVLNDGALCGILRVTTSTNAKRDHVKVNGRIPFADEGGKNEYNRNIQVADLNALNAALAVIKWKKLCGFYHDLEKEHFCTYTIDGNVILSEDKA